MSHTHSLTPGAIKEREDRVVELTRQGKTLQQIADELGMTARGVSHIRKRLGLPKQVQPYPPELVEEAGRMIDEGVSLAETARTLGLSAGTLSHRFRGRSQWNATMAQHYRWMKERLEAM